MVEFWFLSCLLNDDIFRLLILTHIPQVGVPRIFYFIFQIYDVSTGDMITELAISRYSNIQSCAISPTRPLLAVALSHNSVEVSG